MIVKHVNASVDDNSLVFLATSSRGTLLYDYVDEQFLIVEGFSVIGGRGARCVYDLNTVQKFYGLSAAYKCLYSKEV